MILLGHTQHWSNRTLKSLLLLKYEERTADKIVDIFAAVLLIPLTVCGIILLIKTGNNFTLLCVCIYISVYLIAKKRTA